MKCRNINLIAAGACLACGIAYTAANRPVTSIATVVVIGLANLAFKSNIRRLPFLQKQETHLARESMSTPHRKPP